MMRLPAFRYRRPATLDEALRILAGEGPSARPVAGGTDLLPNLKRRHQHADTVVSLGRIDSLRGVCAGAGDAPTRIGAMTTLSALLDSRDAVARHPGLARAVAAISTPVLRNMGTLGGNLCLDTRCTYYNQNEDWRQAIDYCMKEAGSTCWVAPGSPRCWAVSSTDSAPLLIALGAAIVLRSAEGERKIPLEALYRDDGIAYLALRPGELLTEVQVPAPVPGLGSTYWKLRRRGSIDFPVLGVGAALVLAPDGVATAARIVLGAAASAPVIAEEAGRSVLGRRLTEETVAAAARLAAGPATPLDNTDFTLQWRKSMVVPFVEGALREIGGLPPRIRPPRHGIHALTLHV